MTDQPTNNQLDGQMDTQSDRLTNQEHKCRNLIP